MSDDWKVGDLAVCVDAEDHPRYGPSNLVEGCVYTVIGVEVSGQQWADAGTKGLYLAEVVSPAVSGGYRAARFRKIRPDEQEPCEVEFVDLLNRSKPRIDVDALVDGRGM